MYFLVFSKSRLKFPDAFRHSVIKPHNICTKQLVSSIAFECTFPNYCTESSKKNFLINPCLVHHSGFDIVPICIYFTNWYIANLYFLNFNLFNTFWSWHICILVEKKLILITYNVKYRGPLTVFTALLFGLSKFWCTIEEDGFYYGLVLTKERRTARLARVSRLSLFCDYDQTNN